MTAPENKAKTDRRAYMRDWKQNNQQKWKGYSLRYYREMKDDPNDKRHGTLSGYSYGCRCDSCKAAMAEYKKKYRKRKEAEKKEAEDRANSDQGQGTQSGETVHELREE